MLNKVCELVLPAVERHGPIEAWIIDDTGRTAFSRPSGAARGFGVDAYIAKP